MIADVPQHSVAAVAERFPRVAKVTSYCLLGKMRHGGFVHRHAAASVSLPRGARVKFKRRVVGGLKRVRIEDTGGGLVPGQIDVWSPSCDASLAWGVRYVQYRMGW